MSNYSRFHKSASTKAMRDTLKKLGITQCKKTQAIQVSEYKLTPLEDEEFDEGILEHWTEWKALCAPKRRTFHTSCIYNDYLYIFGGKDISEGKFSDICKINLKEEKLQWEEVQVNGQTQLDPLALHSGARVNDKYYIIGGQDLKIYEKNSVYIYDFENNTLELLEFKEDEFSLTEGHTSCYCEEKNCLIIFGGFSKGKETNDVYLFDLEQKTFTKIDNSEKEEGALPTPRSNHGAVMNGGKMYIFGGRKKEGVLLNDLWSYDPVSNEWTNLIKGESKEDEPKEESKNPEAEPQQEGENEREEEPKEEAKEEAKENKQELPKPRVRHTMCCIGDDIYIFGGKIGLMNETNDLWKYSIANNNFTKIHCTLLEQYSKDEIKTMTKKSEETVSVNKKNFILLSKKEMEDRKNPLSKHYVGNKNVLTKKGMARSMSTANCNKTNYEELIFAKSGFHSIKHGPIFGLESDDVNQAIEFLNANLNARLKNAEERKRKGQLPLPRDGQTMEAYENGFIIFGGNRNKFPFNDIFVFNP